MEWWAWFILGFILLMVEMFTPGGFYFMFFGLGAFTVGAVDLLGLDLPRWTEWVMFTVVSLVSLGALRNKVVERYRPTGGRVDEDSIAGTEALAQEMIAPGS
ncbi:MAG TPA: hypothetical protein VD994_18385, partial [Prosthecobacter sp.]|nr:hypothetical protein [Prosthecobacter sp.]